MKHYKITYRRMIKGTMEEKYITRYAENKEDAIAKTREWVRKEFKQEIFFPKAELY